MNKLISFLLIAVIAVYVYGRCSLKHQIGSTETHSPTQTPVRTEAATSSFTCAGKTRCHQMASCEEATFYLKNCPNVEIDGDGDGVPCEKEFCGH
jgi:hypothetical protein